MKQQFCSVQRIVSLCLIMVIWAILSSATVTTHFNANITDVKQASSQTLPDKLETLFVSASDFKKKMKKDKYVFSFFLNNAGQFELEGYRAQNFGGHRYSPKANINLSIYPGGLNMIIDNNTHFTNIILKRFQIVSIMKAIKKYKAKKILFKPKRVSITSSGEYYISYTIALDTDVKDVAEIDLDIDFNPSPPKKY